MIHELPVRKINYKDPVTKQPNRWAYKNPDYEEFYKHHEIDNMAMPIFRAKSLTLSSVNGSVYP